MPQWLRSVVFTLLVLAQALLLGEFTLLALSLLALGVLVALRPEMIRSDRGWRHGLRKTLGLRRALAPASRGCLWLAVAAVPVGLAAGMLDVPTWAATLLVSAFVTAGLTARLAPHRPAYGAAALSQG